MATETLATPTTAGMQLYPEVEAFLAGSPLKSIVGGTGRESSGGATIITHDPGSGEKLAEFQDMTADDVHAAVDAAAGAFKESGWAQLPQNERSVILHRLADLVENQKQVVAQIESLDCGKIFEQAVEDVEGFIDSMRYFADLALHVQRRTAIPVAKHEAFTVRVPWGPCAFIIPWNFPILLLGWGLAPCLAAGNTAVVKPAEDTPLSTLYVMRLIKEAGVPDGVVNVVTGYGETAGAALASNPHLKRMSFTGSPEVGREVAEKCGRNLVPAKMELGGKGAALVFDDVDIDHTADKLVSAITCHAGQLCCNATRWLVQDTIYDRFVNACTDRLKKVRVGHELADSSDMGPVVNDTQVKRILGYLEKGAASGAEVVLEGGPAQVPGRENGHYVKPALLAGSLDNLCAQEEIFGPVSYLARFKDEAQAV